jgi:predicted dehydrogenase/threonine dehydrogenase-like Zn-dependent dehydrogenase
VEAPSPEAIKGSLLIRTKASLVSVGTERMLVKFGKANYLSKARQQPKKVKAVLDKVKTDGISATYEAVQNKLKQPITLGYCNVGEVVAVGDDVTGFSVGDRVASNGNHSEVVLVPKNLCARVPDNVSDEKASFVVLSAIGLQGIRLAKPSLGEQIVVIGLGLIGLMTVQLLRAQGCRVLAVDVQSDRLELASGFGANVIKSVEGEDVVENARKFSGGHGVDAVIIAASTKSHNVVSQAARMCRKRGRIILVGVTGLNLSRDDFYEKELSLQVSCSYGPGRYDSEYEQSGHDYPVGYVRWTVQRNFEAVLGLMESGQIDPVPLISHRVPFEKAPELYQKISDGEEGLGMILTYSSGSSDYSEKNDKTIRLFKKSARKNKNDNRKVVGFIGAGNYASRVLIPAFKAANVKLHSIVTSNGLSGTVHGKKSGFEYSSTDIDKVIKDESIDIIVIATRHDSHSDLVCDALKAGKNVFVEKPLAIDYEGLAAVENACDEISSGPNSLSSAHLMVGFNRRFSPHIIKMRSLLSNIEEPKSFIMTMNAGSIPLDHWTHDSAVGGGRIIGEACHYLDLMRFLAGAPIVEVSGRCSGILPSGKGTHDNAVITLGFSNGSFGTINYFSNGAKSYPKETIEVFSAGRVLVLENFRTLRGYGWDNFKLMKSWRQDKGQRACVQKFLSSIDSNVSVIPLEEIFEVARVSLDINEILRNQA